MALEPLLIAGAAGTGKTVTLQRLVEQVSRIDVPTLLADVKGDLSGLAAAGQEKAVFSERRQQLALSPAAFAPCPVEFWDGLTTPRLGCSRSPSASPTTRRALAQPDGPAADRWHRPWGDKSTGGRSACALPQALRHGDPLASVPALVIEQRHQCLAHRQLADSPGS
jgi:hypothetical protein